MSTDAILEIKFPDGSQFFRMYVHSDTHPETFIPELRKAFKRIDKDDRKERLNWDSLASKLIWVLFKDGRKVKMVAPRSNYNTGIIHYISIKPVFDDFDTYYDKKVSIADLLHIHFSYGSGETIFDGMISTYPEINKQGKLVESYP